LSLASYVLTFAVACASGNPLLATGIPLAEDDVADMFEYMGQAVAADILVQKGRRDEPYKAFKRLHWKLKLPQGEFFPH